MNSPTALTTSADPATRARVLQVLKMLHAGHDEDTIATAAELPVDSVAKIGKVNGWPDPAKVRAAIRRLESAPAPLPVAPAVRPAPKPGPPPTPGQRARAAGKAPAGKPSPTSAGNVRLDRIEFHAHNVRRDLGDLRDLADSIEDHGIVTPVVLEKRGDTYRVRDGHRRIAAARIAGLTHVPAFVHSKALDDRDWVVNAVQANHRRAALQREDRADVIARLRDKGMTWKQVAREFGVTAATVQRWAKPPSTHSTHKKPRQSTDAPTLLAAVDRAWLIARLEEGQLTPLAEILDRLPTTKNGDH